MSVSKRVEEALQRAEAKSFASGLFAASAAVESTVNREFPSFKDRPRRFTTFLAENLEIISRVGFGGGLLGRIGVGAPNTVALDGTIRTDAKGTVATAQALFEVVRCSIVYQARMADFITFCAEPTLHYDGKRFRVSERLPQALAVAVILSPVNRKEWMETNAPLLLNRRPVFANELWGKRDLVGPLLGIGAL